MKKFSFAIRAMLCALCFVLPGQSLLAQITTGQVCYIGTNDPVKVSAVTTYTVNTAAGSVKLRTTFSKRFVDNTYGTGAIGWPSGHTFSNLTGSDKLQLALFDAANVKKLEFTLDYLSASGAAPSGYKCLGVSGGEGGMIVGSAANVLSATTSLDVNFNQYGYVLTTNSPATDTLYTANGSYPNWIYDVWYEVTVNLAAFGAAGFGSSNIVSVHASPSKTGNNTEPVTPGSCVVSIGNYVWNDLNGNGVQNAGEPGIPNVTVTLNGPNNTTQTTTTNASGFYQFSNLTPGTNYSVTFPMSLPGDLKLTAANAAGVSDTADSDASELTGTTHMVSLNVGQNNNTLDAGYVVSNLSLGNQIFVDKNRSGLFDLGDQAMQGLTVRLYRDNNNDNTVDGAFIATATTDLNGAYTFESLAPGNYIVGLVLPPGYGVTLINGGDPDNNIDNDNNGMRMVSGEARGNAITLSAGAEPGGNTNHSYDIGIYDPALPPDGGQKCWGNNNPIVCGTSNWIVNQNSGTVTIRTKFCKSFVDNTYGTGAIGWPNGHTFSNLTGSDNLTWSLRDANGVEKLRFQQDYITASANFPSGYGTVGFDADGNPPTVGNGTDVIAFSTSHDVNFNVYNYILTTNSPATNANYAVNPTYPRYIYDVWYEITVKLSAFGAAGFGTVTHPSLHASPSKTGNNTEIVDSVACPCSVTANAGPDRNLDCQVSSASIGTAAVNGVTYSWSPATGLSASNVAMPVASPATTTTYTVTATAAGGCTATDVVVVNVVINPPAVNAGLDQNLNCTVTSANLITANIGAVSFSWSPAAGLSSATAQNPVASPMVTTTYTLTVTSANGCTASDVVLVNVDKVPPVADAGPDKALTCNVTSVVLGTSAIGGYSYSWSPATGLSATNVAMPIASPAGAMTYTVTVTGANGCTATDVVNVSINQVPPVITISGTPIVCNGSTTTLTATGGSNVQWSTGSNNTSITVGAGTYTVTVTDGVCSTSSTVSVNNVQGTIGNYVWMDDNVDGLQNDGVASGLDGVTVQLWSPGNDNAIGGGDDALLQTTTTANDNLNRPGYYQFIVCNSGNYYVKFPTTVGELLITTANTTAGTDGNSDINAQGNTPLFAINVNGSGVAKDNNTLDAGYFPLKYIGNTVWMDIDRDGIQDNNEVGVAGITVALLDNMNKQVASTVTDAYGNYYFNKMLGGSYRVVVTLPSGYVFSPKDAGADNQADSDVDPVTGISDLFTYQVGTIDLSFDAGIYVPTVLTAEVGDKVWLDDNENGIQDLNEVGVAGVTVTLYNQANTAVLSTITDADGKYNFSKLSPGTYYVGFTLPIGYVLSDAVQGTDTLKDSNPDPATGKTGTFTLVAGQVRSDVDAGIHQQGQNTASLGNFVWNDVNSNGIQDANEPGMPGITVTLYDQTGVNALNTATTDILGNYTFNDLQPGTYHVGFGGFPAGFSLSPALQGNNSATDSDPNPQNGMTGPIVLLAGQANTTIDAGVNNPQAPLGGIGNFVWFDRDLDGVQDGGNENGVGGVSVELFNSLNQKIGYTVSDNEGFYIFNGLPAGSYYVRFSNLPVNFKLSASNQGNNDAIDSDPDGATGKTPLVTIANNEVNLTLDAGLVSNTGRNNKASLGDHVWNDANQNGLQDPNELGVQGVNVTLYQDNGISVITTTTTNALGEYIFTNLDPGNYVIGFAALPQGFIFTYPNQGGDDEADSDVLPANGGKTGVLSLDEGDINLTVDAGIFQNLSLGSIGDFVWNDVNQNGLQDAGEPGIPGVTVKLLNGAGNTVLANTTSDGKGAYQFTGLNPGTYVVEFSNLPVGYKFVNPDASAVPAPGGLPTANDDIDSDADTLTGRTPVIAIVGGQANMTIDAGLFTTRASMGDYVWVDVNNNGVQDANENGLSGITVTLYDAANNPVTTAVTNSLGAYQFVNLDPGTYSVGFSNIPVAGTFSPANMGLNDSLDSDADQLSGRTGNFTLVAGQYNPTVDAGVHLPTGSGLGDYVWLDLNADGMQQANEPGVPGVTVTLFDKNDVPLRSTITDQNGAYSFNNLIPDTFRVGFSTLPTYYQPNGQPYQSSFTLFNLGGSDLVDSDVDPGTGKTGLYPIAVGQYNPTVDAGIKLDLILPALELRAFAALKANSVVGVSWKTEYETNTGHFEIERSMDGSSFEKVGEMDANGFTVGSTFYSMNDDLSGVQRKDVVYYRIRMVDQDGKFMLSNTVNVRILESDAEILVYPSPFGSNINVLYQTETSTQVNVKITDLNGRVVAEKNADVSAGRNIITLDQLGHLASGMYTVRVTDVENGVSSLFKVSK